MLIITQKFKEILKYISILNLMNLLSPRYFENIASGCFIITEKNKDLEKLIPKSSIKNFLKTYQILMKYYFKV